MNWEEACQKLGVSVTATPDEIRAQYLYRVQLLHPDKTVGLPDRARQQAEEELKSINAAYSVLKDPKNNTLRTPPKLKVSPSSIRFTEVGTGQHKTTQIRIESVGGPYTRFWMGDSPASWLRIAEVKSSTGDPLPLEVTIEATGTGSSQKRWQCELPVRLENEKTHMKDETVVRLEMNESVAAAPGHAAPNTAAAHGQNDRNVYAAPAPVPGPAGDRSAVSGRYRTLAFLLVPPAAGLVVLAFLKTLIPFWILLAFGVSYVAQRWFTHPFNRDKRIGMPYRIVLNLSMLSYLGFMIWSAVELFSRRYMASPLIGSLVFVGQCAFLFWLGHLVNKNSWRKPSMKLTIAALIAAFLIFAYAGVEPMQTYKDDALTRLSSFFDSASR